MIGACLPLTVDDATRLGKLLGLLGSDHDGERAAAALKATALIRERGITWADIAGALVPVVKLELEWRDAANACLAADVSWSQREFDFLTNMTRLRRPPSPAQAEWLDQLAALARGVQEAA